MKCSSEITPREQLRKVQLNGFSGWQFGTVDGFLPADIAGWRAVAAQGRAAGLITVQRRVDGWLGCVTLKCGTEENITGPLGTKNCCDWFVSETAFKAAQPKEHKLAATSLLQLSRLCD